MGKRLNDIEQLEPYLWTITRNKCLDMLRRMKMETAHRVSLENSPEESTNETEETILLKDTRQILEEGITRLPPQQKRVYQLCRQEGLSYDQAAEQLQISAQTVHRHMKLALRFLRRYLQDHTDLAIVLILLGLS